MRGGFRFILICSVLLIGWLIVITVVFPVVTIENNNARKQDIADLQAKDAQHDAEIADLQQKNVEQDQEIAGLSNRVEDLEAKDLEQDTQIQNLTDRVGALETNDALQDARIQNLTAGLGNLEMSLAMLNVDLMQAFLDLNPVRTLIQNGTILWVMNDGFLCVDCDPAQQNATSRFEVNIVMLAGYNHTVFTVYPFSPSPMTYTGTLSFGGYNAIGVDFKAFFIEYTNPIDPTFDIRDALRTAFGVVGFWPMSRANYLNLAFMSTGEAQPDCITSGSCEQGAYLPTEVHQSYYVGYFTNTDMMGWYYSNRPDTGYAISPATFELLAPLDFVIFEGG